MPCATIKVVKPEQPSPPPTPQITLDNILPIVAILGSAAFAYYMWRR